MDDPDDLDDGPEVTYDLGDALLMASTLALMAVLALLAVLGTGATLRGRLVPPT